MVIKKQIQSKQTKELITSDMLKDRTLLQVRSLFRETSNSKGIVISRKMMDLAGIHTKNIIIEASKGEIRIRPINNKMVNTDLSSWD